MVTLGITGSLGTGKTTVAKMFAEHGAKVIDADKIVHELLIKDKTCVGKIAKFFGSNILTRGRIDRNKLAGIVFNQPEKLKILEKIIHPAVKSEIKKRIAEVSRSNRYKAVVLDVPLLFESGIDREVDWTVTVLAKRSQQIQRVIQGKNLTKIQALKRMRAQMPLKDKIRLAEVIIDNRGNLTQTKKQVKDIWQKIIRK